jgi:hypothetical protein
VLPDYWLERPSGSWEGATHAAVEEFLSSGQRAATDGPLDLDPIVHTAGGVTPWEFLCGVAERREIAFHGTGDPHIRRFEPREPIDFAPFGQQKAVFATTDPIWAMFYAIVDRDRFQLTLNNGCILVDVDGRRGLPYYYFSITADALREQPWRTGYVYFLPAETFVAQPAATYAGHRARVPQLASPVAVTPFARLRVAPGDFPFLAQIRGHDDGRLAEYAQAVMTAAPWPH